MRIARDEKRGAFLEEVRGRPPKPDLLEKQAAKELKAYRKRVPETPPPEPKEIPALCERCGANDWAVRYGSYEALGTCNNCGAEASLYQG